MSLLSPVAARADFFIHHWEDHHEYHGILDLGVDVGYYGTHQNFDGSGQLMLPLGLTQYSRIESGVMLNYGLSSRFNLYTHLDWTYIDLNSSVRPGNVFGLTDQSVGMNFRAVEKKNAGGFLPTSIDFQVQGDLPAYSNSNAQTNGTPFLGDGSIDVTGGAFLSLPIWQNPANAIAITAGGGYTYRTANFSAAVPWSAVVAFVPKEEGITLSAGVLGLISLRTDPQGQAGVSGSSQSFGTGGSFLTNAVNPSLVTIRGQLGYAISPEVAIQVSVSQDIWGQAAPDGFNAVLGFQARIGQKITKDAVHLTAKEYGRANQGFVNYSLEAHVMRANDRLNLVKIDKGSQDGVEVGQVFDIFVVKPDGSVGEAVARGQVAATKTGESSLTVTDYYKEVWIDEGFIAKRPIQ